MLTNTDKAVNITALIFITFLIGYKPMFKEILGDIIGGALAVVGGIIAARYALIITKKKEKEEEKQILTDIQISFTNILEKLIIPELNLIQNLKTESLEQFEKNIYFIPSKDFFLVLNRDFMSFFDLNLVQKLFIQKKTDIYKLYDIITRLDYLKDNTPTHIVSLCKDDVETLTIYSNNAFSKLKESKKENDLINIEKFTHDREYIDNQIESKNNKCLNDLTSFFDTIEDTKSLIEELLVDLNKQ
ncbi:hypothetical protein HX004_03705 [Myroides sp. 1354]|uniref:hypothetical protein n=1 Tax=unclassified Myroides TaxID=2642485 RepID=UPI002577B5CD|nr:MULTISPECIES: hypothetical protein [unclassified Myroides]MDM1043950.1 hypothetical protein [Myroides sp. R163-1]MDM1054885.1 hypothetical protein [Myroides sp. 1354]MDM1068182.1 hypothetical protein [Myroides sp. 1372]